MVNLPLTKIAETTKTITLGWTPIACEGYVFWADSKRVSNTWDASKSEIRFAKGASSYRVQALGVSAEGAYPAGPSSPPVPGSLANMYLPFGQAIPLTDGTDWGGFNMIDYEGYGSSTGRITEVSHPGDPTKRAIRFYLRYNDVADHYGGHRCEIWRKPGDLVDGVTTSWNAVSWWLEDDFTVPSTGCMFQVHGGDYDPIGNPMQLFGVEWNGQMRFYSRGITTNSDYLGAFVRFVEIRFLMKIVHSRSSSGSVQFWLKTDGSTPNELDTPTRSYTGQTNASLPALDSYTKIGLYTQLSQGSTDDSVAYLCGFGRADTAKRAKYLAGWG